MTYMAKSHDVNLDSDYLNWVDEIVDRYEMARTRSIVKVNREKLLWNWQMGCDMVMRKAEERWGTGIVEQLSLDLQNRYPNEKGFSSRNLWNMKRWYLFYAEKLHQAGAEIGSNLFQSASNSSTKLHQAGAEINKDDCMQGIAFPDIFGFVPWRHHVDIISKCSTLEEALFYIGKTIDGNWSRAVLGNNIKAKLYKNHAAALSNYALHLDVPQAELAQEMTKENYDFGFLTLPESFNEQQLEDALCKQMTRFLLELLCKPLHNISYANKFIMQSDLN